MQQTGERDGLVAQTAAPSARAGMYLPLTMAPSTTSQRAFASGLGGYDTARKTARYLQTLDATLIGPVAARVTIEYGERAGTLRPGGGLRVQALSQERFGVDLTLAVMYRAEGFTQAEGEVEGTVALARHFGAWGVFANLVYGQDGEGKERDGELRLATLYELGDLQLGVDTRARFDLGSTARPGKPKEPTFDAQSGALAMYAWGPVALLANAGFSGVSLHGNFRSGFVALAGLGGSI